MSVASIVLYCAGLVAAGLIAAVLVLVWARRQAQKQCRLDYSVREPKGIESLDFVEIGGIKQAIHIRGRDRNNPVLLFIHGGPGMAQIGWYDAMQRPWEDYFTVVQWDQRQVGKSYSKPDSKNAAISTEQMLTDSEEVVAYLRKHLNKDRIFIMGWSYGTYLGMHLVKRKPEWIHAYIALGQFTSPMDNFREEHALLLQHAVDTNNKELEKDLRAMMPRIDPNNKLASFLAHSGKIGDELSKIGKAGRRFIGAWEFIGMMNYSLYLSPYYSLMELFRVRKGRGWPSFMAFSDDFMESNLPMEVGNQFAAPIFFFTGRHDWHVPYSLTDQWFQKIQAPYKEQVWFEESAHMIPHEEPGKLLVALVEKVLPLAQQAMK